MQVYSNSRPNRQRLRTDIYSGHCMKRLRSLPILELELIEKQKIFNARLSLSDDPEAKEMVESMKMAAIMLGGDANKSIGEIFDDLLDKVAKMKTALESGTGD